MAIVTIAIAIERESTVNFDADFMKRVLAKEKIIHRHDYVRFHIILGTLDDLVAANRSKAEPRWSDLGSMAAEGQR